MVAIWVFLAAIWLSLPVSAAITENSSFFTLTNSISSSKLCHLLWASVLREYAPETAQESSNKFVIMGCSLCTHVICIAVFQVWQVWQKDSDRLCTCMSLVLIDNSTCFGACCYVIENRNILTLFNQAALPFQRLRALSVC